MPKKSMADSISEKQIKKDVNDILKDADLTQLSSKKIRKQLEEKYGSDLTDRKKEIDTIVLDAIEAKDNQNSEVTTTVTAKEKTSKEVTKNGETMLHPNKSHNESDGESSGSDLDAPEDMGPPVKKKKAQKKSDGDSDENDDDDAEIARKLQEEENFQGRRTRGGRKTPSKKPAKTTKSPKANGTKKNNLYAKECMLSPTLAAVMGTEKMKRSDVVKRMWEVVKERDLQDPKNKSFMLCDDELYKVFGRKRVKTFGMMKYLTDHIFTPEDYETHFGIEEH